MKIKFIQWRKTLIEFRSFSIKIHLLVLSLALMQKSNSQPALLSQHCYGGSLEEIGIQMIKTSDNGFISIGLASSINGDVTTNHGLDDIWIIKFDSLRNILWQKTFGGTLSDVGVDIVETSDHGFVFISNIDSDDGDILLNHGNGDIWLTKINSLGTIQWQKTFGGSEYDYAISLLQYDANSICIFGNSLSNDGDFTSNSGDEDIWIIKSDLSGNVIWKKNYGGSYDDVAYKLIKTIDGDLIFAGGTLSDDGDVSFNHGSYDTWVVKTDLNGNINWEKSYGGSDEDVGTYILKLSNNQYIVTSYSASSDGDISSTHGASDFWILKIDSIGNILDEKSFGGSSDEFAFRTIQTNDGKIIISGSCESNDQDVSGYHDLIDMWIIEVDTSLNLIWTKCLGGSQDDEANFILSDVNLIAGGYTLSNNYDVSGNHSASEDMWIVEIERSVGITENEMQLVKSFPNPVSDFITIDLTSLQSHINAVTINLFDITGHTIEKITTTSRQYKLDMRNYPSGVYVIQTINGDLERKIKIVKT